MYLYLGAFIGLSATVAGVIALIVLVVDQGFDAFRGFSISGSAAVLALIIAGGITWRFFWRNQQTIRESARMNWRRFAQIRR